MNDMPDLPEISDDQFVPWTAADRAADFGDLLGHTFTPLDSTDPKWADYSTMKTLTCRNHLGAEYITKNPWTRSLFQSRADDKMVAEYLDLAIEEVTDQLCRAYSHIECPCKFGDLIDTGIVK